MIGGMYSQQITTPGKFNRFKVTYQVLLPRIAQSPGFHFCRALPTFNSDFYIRAPQHNAYRSHRDVPVQAGH